MCVALTVSIADRFVITNCVISLALVQNNIQFLACDIPDTNMIDKDRK